MLDTATSMKNDISFLRIFVCYANAMGDHPGLAHTTVWLFDHNVNLVMLRLFRLFLDV